MFKTNGQRRGESQKGKDSSFCHLHLMGRGLTGIPISLVIVFRKSSFPNVGSSPGIGNRQSGEKRIKPDGQVLADKTLKRIEKMIEIDLVSSDEDF